MTILSGPTVAGPLRNSNRHPAGLSSQSRGDPEAAESFGTAPCRPLLSSGERFHQLVQILLPDEERLHVDALILAVGAHIEDVGS
jgi:hypothetical protein